MAIGTGTVTADVEATATLAPSRGRVRLPRSPKILAGLGILTFFVLLAIIGPFVRPYDPGRNFANATVPLAPSAAHWLGTTQLQQDVFSQLLVGGGSMILVALVSGVIATALSVIIGVTAGYKGGLTDDLLSMLANVFLVLPALPLLIILLGFIGTTSANLLLVAFVISLTGWAWGARVLRAQTLSLRNRDYVDAARITGESSWRIIRSEIVPNLMPIIASSFLFTVLYAIGTYTALAFLALVNPEWSWGGMLYYASSQTAELDGYWWWFLPPGLAIALLGTALVLLNFGIDEFINPRLRVAGLTGRPNRRRGGSSRQGFALTPVIIRAEGDNS